MDSLEENVERFIVNLHTSEYKSDFDSNFLHENTAESLFLLTSDEWIHLFSVRLKELWMSDYDWTRIGLYRFDWSKSKVHANYHWYQLAVFLSKLTEKHITEIVFPGITIAKQDFDILNNPRQFSGLIYTNNFESLVVLNRIFIVTESCVHKFGGYDIKGESYPVSPFDLSQIRHKLTRSNQYYKPMVILNSCDFRLKYLSLWGEQIPTENFKNLLYPFYQIIADYFEALADPALTVNTHSLLHDFYKRELEHLPLNEVTFFYGQIIERGKTMEDSVFLHDIILNLMDATTDLSCVLPDMVKLAVWITLKNPAMLISHPDVDQIYRTEKLGPYLTQGQLAQEMLTLLRLRQELPDNDFNCIDTLKNALLLESQVDPMVAAQSLPGPVREDDLFAQIMNIFSLRDKFNQAETCTRIIKRAILPNAPYEYVYHREGANTQYIRVAQLLQASGFLKRHGVDDYFQLLMPSLVSPIDSVTRNYLSINPLSHYIRPENDPTYLIYLENSLEHYKINQCFYNVNASKARSFSPKEFDYISFFAAEKFRKYPRVPTVTNYVLRASTLKELVDLVNNSLHYEAVNNDGDGYTLRAGLSEIYSTLPEKVIEYQLQADGVSYQLRDSWNVENIYKDTIAFKDCAEKRRFMNDDSSKRLIFILNVAMHKGHARADISTNQYYNACIAYEHFREFYFRLDTAERERLDNVSMRYAGIVRTFGEIWLNGFPTCMAAASKWFSTLILDYLPAVSFRFDLENNEKYQGYLSIARQDSQHLYSKFLINDRTESIDELNHLLTHDSHQMTSIAGLQARARQLFGMPAYQPMVEPATERLLKISDVFSGFWKKPSEGDRKEHSDYSVGIPANVNA